MQKYYSRRKTGNHTKKIAGIAVTISAIFSVIINRRRLTTPISPRFILEKPSFWSW